MQFDCPSHLREHEERNRRISDVIDPLPGSVPYLNVRQLRVAQRFDRLTVIEFLTQMKTNLSTQEWLDVIYTGNLRRGNQPVTPQSLVYQGERLNHLIPNTVEPDVNPNLKVLFEDKALLAIDKPAPLAIHPSGRFNKNTALHILKLAFPEMLLRPVHRLDANTTGMCLFAKTKSAASAMSRQFESRLVEKVYLVRVLGHPRDDSFTCDMQIQKSPSEAGSRRFAPAGLAAVTQFKVLARLSDGTSLLRGTPLTGRTNQIRIHLAEIGHSVLGDTAYGVEKDLSRGLCKQDKLFLHALSLCFSHPLTHKRVHLTTQIPLDFL